MRELFKRFICAALAGCLASSSAWAGATFSRVKTWSSGETLTASDLNAEFNNILNNLTPAGVDDYSATTTEMRAVTDPYPGSAESQATSLQGELERIRYQILEIKKAMQTSNVTYWYQDLPTAGVFTIAGSSVGVNDTTPSYALDVTGTAHVTSSTTLNGDVIISSNVYSDGNITTTGDDVDISTHAAITGNLSVGGSLTVTGAFNPSVSHVIAVGTAQTLTDNTGTILQWTESSDSLSEFNGSTFTATNAGFYDICVQIDLNAGGDTYANYQQVAAEVLKNGVATVSRFAPLSATNNWTVNFCESISLSASGTISVRATANTAGGGSSSLNTYSQLNINRRL